MLTQALQLKKITFQEGVFEEQAGTKDDDRFDADVALATGELGGLIDDLIEALGGEADPAAFPTPPSGEAAVATTTPTTTPITAGDQVAGGETAAPDDDAPF